MAEILSPKPTKATAPIQTSAFFLGSNDDQLERACAARAFAVRRTYVAVNAPTPPPPPDTCLGREQIIELFQNCIKLASENKINQNNTWELKLIDHLSEIIKVEVGDDSKTNFQKASCTLEAGVKIYSLRVDSVHSEAYKVLGRIVRAGGEDEQGTEEGGDTSNGPVEGFSKKKEAKERKVSPLSTLEPSFEALNVKKFDVAFTADPLYYQTCALLDAGGAKGLLLNNLGVYGGCRIFFDSFEVPRKCISRSIQDPSIDIIDLSFTREYIEQMLMNMSVKYEISPTLRDIVRHFDEDNQRPPNTFSEAHKNSGVDYAAGDGDVQLDSNSSGIFEAAHSDYEEESDVVAENFTFGDASFSGHHEEDGLHTSYVLDKDERSGVITPFLSQGLGFTRKQNAWAGPDHWKYREPKGANVVSLSENRSGVTTKRSTKKILADQDIDFIKSLEEPIPDIFVPPKNPKLLLLPANRVPWGSSLPEDCHYEPEVLVKLFLLPSVMCFGKGKKKNSDHNSLHRDGNFDEQIPPWDNDTDSSGHANVCFNSDEADSGGLVSHPRQVHKIEVQYDKTFKQVDLHVLKESLWDHIQESIQVPEMVCRDTISFKHVLATFPDACQAAPAEDISPHLCFICLLHLANEHSLSIYGCSTLDDLSIQLPSSCGNT